MKYYRSGGGSFHSPRSPKYQNQNGPMSAPVSTPRMANGNTVPQQNRSNSADNRENGDHRGHSFPPVGLGWICFVSKNFRIKCQWVISWWVWISTPWWHSNQSIIIQFIRLTRELLRYNPLTNDFRQIIQPMIYNPSSFNYSPMAHPNLQPHQHPHHHQQPFQQFVNQSQQSNQQAGEQQAQNVYQASYMIPTHPMMQPTVSCLSKSFINPFRW